MGEYNGNARKRVETIGERLEAIRAECIGNLERALCDFDGVPRMDANRIARDHIRMATAAVAAAYVKHYEERDRAAAAAKQDAARRIAYRPGRWGKS